MDSLPFRCLCLHAAVTNGAWKIISGLVAQSLWFLWFTVKEDAIWDGVVCLCGKEPDFFFFSLPDFPGEVGIKTEQETALEFMFCPEDEGNALKSSFLFLCISSPKKQKRLKENHHLGVCVIYMQMLLCFYRGGYSFQDKTTESEGLWSLKSMCDVICVLFNLLSRPVNKQELGLSEIPGRLRGIFLCCNHTIQWQNKLPEIFIFFSPTHSLYCDGTNSQAPSGPCEPGYLCTGGAKSALQQMVMEGHYSLTGAFRLEPCPLGSFQPVSTLEFTVRCLWGHHSHWQLYECVNSHLWSVCKQTP